MIKKQFREALVYRLHGKGITIDFKAIESALTKTARHMNNTIGGIEWSEDQLGNAECYYQEYGNQSTTFNQAMHRGRNTGTGRF